ncbi:MAG: hypothetical protein HOJ60_00065 [Euryarchaeota archaeon]|nr:hypothetical protein [Euryarchaeota archaeon]
MSSKSLHRAGKFACAILPLLLLLLSSISPMLLNGYNTSTQLEKSPIIYPVNDNESWAGGTQPWGQYARTPTHNGTMPPHGPNGGPGEGSVDDVTIFGTIDSPVVNWVGLENGADAYGSIIADFSQSITAPNAALERCGMGELFAVTVSKDGIESLLTILSGDEAKVAWEVNLGETKDIRSTPMVHDIDDDGKPEIIVVYDTSSSLHVELWSPELTCTESGWQKSGHANEKLWSYTDSNYRIGITSAHFPTRNSGHLSVTQPLLADLQLDGTPELVLAAVDENTEDPTVLSFTLTTSVPSEADWEISLDRGTHPSDPTWAALDSSTSAIVLTTIDSNSGNMWVWRIDGATGSLDWERVAIQGTDSDGDGPPRLRLPGPVIVQLDNDDAPEMILTVPTDSNGQTTGNGARFIGMELTSTNEIFNFRAQNGFADAQPLPVDTTDDGIHDRLCWVTWYRDSNTNPLSRKGMIGCHDISLSTPLKEWSRDLQRGNGVDNDEIAVSSPIWLDIDGNDEAEILVAFGQRLWAFDGETGASADINSAWSSPLAMPHRVWAGPAVADMDGDGTLDILVGDTLVSQSAADFAPLADNRGISFNPVEPDPGQQVTITGQFSNIGTIENDDDLDVVLYLNGNEIARERFDDVEPVSPSGEGGPLTFSAVVTAELGIHNVTMVLDINGNISEAREDNNMATAELVIVEPYVARIDLPIETPRISPGTTESVSIELIAIGSRTAEWSLTWDDSALPSGWNFNLQNGVNVQPNLVPNSPEIIGFDVTIPSDALGDDNSFIDFTLTLNEDTSIQTTIQLPLEVLRTRGLSVTGPSGLGMSDGYGRIQDTARAWMVVENLGNAQESTTSIDWTAPSWGGSPTLHNSDGDEIFSLTLNPTEQMELFAHLDVPSSVNLGSTTSTTLTLCIGSGSETLCQNLVIQFTAVSSVVSPVHARSLPNATLSWQIGSELPLSGMLQWNMVEAQMIHTDWQWSASGDLTIIGSNLELSGSSNGVATGTLTLQLPSNTVPYRHVFTTPDANEDYSNLTFSLQVLQIFRSNATLLEPLPSVIGGSVSMNVSEPQNVLLRLENPGNGVDEFLLSAQANPIPGEDSSPTVDFNFISSQHRTLGSLAYTISTVEVTLGADVPAQTPFELEFHWTSLGDTSVEDSVIILVEAEPDHRWDINITSGLEYQVSPDESVSIDFTAMNTGNANDTLSIIPSFTYDFSGLDSSPWSAPIFTGQMLEVNQSSTYNLEFIVPSTSWADTVAHMQFGIYSGSILIEVVSLNFTVEHLSGWRFNLANTSLTIDPAGQNVSLTIDQLGNAPRAPYIVKAGAGWNISYPEHGEVVQPFQSTSVVVFVIPPENAVAGEIGILQIRISDADGSGSTIQEIPVRVGDAPNLTLDHRGVWIINDNGGMPTAWVENNGNDVAVLQLGVSGLPSGWTIDGPSQMVVAPNQLIGIPLNLIPSEGWSGQRFLVSLEVTHPTLGLQIYDIEVEKGTLAFGSTPVAHGVSQSEVHILLNSNVSEGDLTSDESFTMDGNSVSVVLSGERNEVILVSSTDSSEMLSLYLAGYMLPSVEVDCNLDYSAFAQLGLQPLTDTVGECQIIASEESVRATIVLLSNAGERVDLINDIIQLGAYENGSFEINVSDWTPPAGMVDVQVMVIDSYGRILDSYTISVTSRSSGWNLGIYSFSSEDGDLTISIQREQYQRLADVTCRIEVVSLSQKSDWSTTRVVDVVSSDYAPVVFINNPVGIENGINLEATLSCDTPYDIDDNPDDNTMTAVFKADIQPIVEQSDILGSIGVATVLLIIAFFAGAFNQNAPQKQSKKNNQGKPLPKIADSVTESVEDVEDDDEFSFVFDENAMVEVIEAPIEEVPVEEVIIDIDDEGDDSASGRLASLRDEMGEDGNKRQSREDRMSRFFGDK